MAASAIQEPQSGVRHTLGVARLLVTGAATGAVVFVICWVGTLLPYGSPTHAYIGLFTNAEMSSGRALIEGSIWSLLFGGLTAGLFAVIYNATATLARR